MPNRRSRRVRRPAPDANPWRKLRRAARLMPRKIAAGDALWRSSSIEQFRFCGFSTSQRRTNSISSIWDSESTGLTASTPMPLIYRKISRGDLIQHLSEHHGDGSPGARIRIMMRGVEALHREISAKGYRYMRPGLETTPWGTLKPALSTHLAICSAFVRRLTNPRAGDLRIGVSAYADRKIKNAADSIAARYGTDCGAMGPSNAGVEAHELKCSLSRILCHWRRSWDY